MSQPSLSPPDDSDSWEEAWEFAYDELLRLVPDLTTREEWFDAAREAIAMAKFAAIREQLCDY